MGKGRGSLVPSLTAFVVCDLLSSYCPRYMDSSFTATMEANLDSIARGEGDKLSYLREYYEGPEGLQSLVEKVREWFARRLPATFYVLTS